MKAILIVCAVLAFTGFNQAVTTVDVPLTFTNNGDKSLTMTFGPQSATVPASMMMFAPMVLNMISKFVHGGTSSAPLSLPFQVEVNDDGSVSTGAMGFMLEVPAVTVNQFREVLAYMQKLISKVE